jgi:hypothetical protein
MDGSQGTASAVAPPVDAAAQRDLVQRVLNSDLFARSHRLSAFLKFICEQTAAGNASIINEQKIGTEVFGRAPGYHVGEDSIVRSQARFLRQRLEQYFATEGKSEPVVLLIPKGSYLPAFEPRQLPEQLTEQPTPFPSAEKLDVGPHRKKWGLLVLGAIALTALVAGVETLRSDERRPQAEKDPLLIRAFWGSVFAPPRNVLIVPSDSSLVLMQEISGKPVSLQAYASRRYLDDPAGQKTPLRDIIVASQYTNMADLNTVGRLEKLPEAEGVSMTLRYARDLTLKELKESNAILIGGARSNPWVQLYIPITGFDVDYDYGTKHNVVRNRAMQAGEKAVYIEDRSGTTEPSRAYGVVTYAPSLDGQGHTILLEGTSKAGTEAAAEFLSSPDFAKLLTTLGSTERAIPSFEVLISTSSMAGSSYRPLIVCWHMLRRSSTN